MDIESIRTLLSVAQLGGFTRAGEHLRRSQPAISRRIGLIERELGAPLLERVRGGVRLTEAGQAFLPFAEAALAAIKDGCEAVRAAVTEERGDVSLALVGTLADTRIVEVLRSFAKRSKSGALDLRTASSQEVSDLVRRGEVTLGLRYFADERPELISKVVTAETMLVICPPEHPLAGRRAGRAELAGERWIGFPAVHGRESFGHILNRRLMAAGLDDAKVTVIDSLTAQKRLVEAGFGIALVPESGVRDELKLGLLQEIPAPLVRTSVPIAVIHLRKGYLNSAAKALIALLSDASLRLDGKPRPIGRSKRV
jgi:DNA-binding transcriptional LysR family regulator